MPRKDRRPADRPQHGSWLPLSIALQKKVDEAGSSSPGDRHRARELLRAELNRPDDERMRHRYLDREGKAHENDLPTDLQLEDLRFESDEVIRGRQVIYVHDGRGENGGPRIERHEAIGAYGVEVFLPSQEPVAAASALPDAASRKVTKTETFKGRIEEHFKDKTKWPTLSAKAVALAIGALPNEESTVRSALGRKRDKRYP
jgi:hypothetical protein